MRRAFVVALGGCFQPQVATGVPCSSTRDCPSGQVCAANDRCELPGRDGAIDIAIDAPPPWSMAQKLDSLNTPSHETDPTISADGLDIVFASNRAGGLGGTDLYAAHRASITDPFGPPVRITELSTIGDDQAAELTGDGLTLYVRRMGATSLDVYTARRATRTGTFDTPVLETQLSSPDEDGNPAISRDALTFSITRTVGTDRDLYLYERNTPNQSWGMPRQITELSTPAIESGAAFGSNGLVVFFHSDRDSLMPNETDLYVANRSNRNQPFGMATRVAELATELNESDPSVTPDLRLIVFECASDLCFATR